MEAGLAIVALAIALDRLSQAAATLKPASIVAAGPFWQRYPHLALALRHSRGHHAAQPWPCRALQRFRPPSPFSTAPLWKAGVDWVTVNFFDAIEAFRVGLLVYVLNPVRAFCLGLPWLGAVLLLGLAGCAARRRAARDPRRRTHHLLCGDGAVGKNHGHGLSLRRLGRYLGADRHSDRYLGVTERSGGRLRQRRSSTRCRPYPPSASSSPSSCCSASAT